MPGCQGRGASVPGCPFGPTVHEQQHGAQKRRSSNNNRNGYGYGHWGLASRSLHTHTWKRRHLADDCRQFVCSARRRCCCGAIRRGSLALSSATLTHTHAHPHEREQTGRQQRRRCAAVCVSERARAKPAATATPTATATAAERGSLERIFELERRGQNNCVLDSLPCGSQREL